CILIGGIRASRSSFHSRMNAIDAVINHALCDGWLRTISCRFTKALVLIHDTLHQWRPINGTYVIGECFRVRVRYPLRVCGGGPAKRGSWLWYWCYKHVDDDHKKECSRTPKKMLHSCAAASNALISSFFIGMNACVTRSICSCVPFF